MSKTIVVARLNKEDVSWLNMLPEWKPQVCEYYRPIAREAYAYLDWIVHHLNLEDEDEIIFCQGNPFEHCPNFISDIKIGKVCFGWREKCDGVGMPRGKWMPLLSYSDVLGIPRQECYEFIPGAQFRVAGEQIKSRPMSFYSALFHLCQLDQPDKIAWVLERLWPLIFDIDLSE